MDAATDSQDAVTAPAGATLGWSLVIAVLAVAAAAAGLYCGDRSFVWTAAQFGGPLACGNAFACGFAHFMGVLVFPVGIALALTVYASIRDGRRGQYGAIAMTFVLGMVGSAFYRLWVM
jgi:hypothetical protein